ncbi:GGDEF domain-containing response regulator [Hyalangium rubrum]|uniref:diguanylate cyclase n=1 Tax=Hyalangium rubrum TaxID=3103134 RepID=A0ABU5HC52_9BACT|nr:diguanylate cyclase [Hyalangium sp. s54d21]MDY7230413.1 diguanylate cyclase [Hyalangium sp. s54d21]
MGDKPFALLVVEDSRATAAKLAGALGSEAYAPRVVPPGPEVLRLAMEVDLVLWCLGPDDDLALLRRLMDVEVPTRRVPVLAIAPMEARELRLTALRLGVEVVSEPWDEEELRVRMQRCFSHHLALGTLGAQVIELQKLSVLDGLTLVHNRRYFQERLREEFRSAQRYDDALALILVDLDHFRALNDRHGQPVGDEVLRAVARVLQKTVRETDLVARYGGEEFAVLLPRTHMAGAITVAERIWKEMGGLHLGPERQLQVTVSLGISSFPHRTVLSPEQLVLTAEEALVRAKTEGRNRICLHSPVSLLAGSRRG